MINVVIAGGRGKMGTAIAKLIDQSSIFNDFQVRGKLEDRLVLTSNKVGNPHDPTLTDQSSVIESADVVIDFTVPDATIDILNVAKQHKKPYVLGTTGFNDTQQNFIALASKTIPIVQSSNMSPGVNAFFKAAQQVAKALPGYSVHIQETHHVHKKDAPSGTALQAGRLIEQIGGQHATYESFREGEVIGDHRVIFSGPLDRVELFHHAETRDIFAAGALQAARWVIGRKPGLYSMFDVLGFE